MKVLETKEWHGTSVGPVTVALIDKEDGSDEPFCVAYNYCSYFGGRWTRGNCFDGIKTAKAYYDVYCAEEPFDIECVDRTEDEEAIICQVRIGGFWHADVKMFKNDHPCEENRGFVYVMETDKGGELYDAEDIHDSKYTVQASFYVTNELEKWGVEHLKYEEEGLEAIA